MVDVQAGNDGLLAGEDGLLDAFHNLHRVYIYRVVAGDQTELKDNDWRVQKDTIDDDHDQDKSEDARTADNEVEARPENDRKAGDIGHPPSFANDGNQYRRGFVLEFFQDVARGLEDETDRCDDDGPEVQSTVALEGHIDKHKELQTHQVRNGTEGRDEAECYGAWRRSVD